MGFRFFFFFFMGFWVVWFSSCGYSYRSFGEFGVEV